MNEQLFDEKKMGQAQPDSNEVRSDEEAKRIAKENLDSLGRDRGDLISLTEALSPEK